MNFQGYFLRIVWPLRSVFPKELQNFKHIHLYIYIYVFITLVRAWVTNLPKWISIPLGPGYVKQFEKIKRGQCNKLLFIFVNVNLPDDVASVQIKIIYKKLLLS